MNQNRSSARTAVVVALGLHLGLISLGTLQGRMLVEAVKPGSSIADAGVLVDDVILAWSRLDASDRHALEVSRDWLELVEEEASRGVVLLHGLRGELPMTFEVNPGPWEVAVRPPLSAEALSLYHSGRQLISEGQLEEGLRVWRRFLGGGQPALDPATLVRLALRVAEEVEAQGGWKAVAQFHHNIARELSEDAFLAAILQRSLGLLLRHAGEFAAALEAFERALKLAEVLADRSLVPASILREASIAASRAGDPRRAEGYATRSLDLWRRHAPMSAGMARAATTVGLIANTGDDLSRAAKLLGQARDIFRQVAPGSEGLQSAYLNLGMIAAEQGDLLQAEQENLRALEIYKGLGGDNRTGGFLLNNLGLIAYARADYDRAEDYLLQALEVKKKWTPGGQDLGPTLYNLGRMALELNADARAEGYYRQARELLAHGGEGSLIAAGVANGLGDVALRRGALDEAEQYQREALEIQQKITPSGLHAANSIHRLAQVLEAKGETEAAAANFVSALEIQQSLAPGSIDTPFIIADLARFERQRGQLKQAEQRFKEAVEAFDQLVARIGGSQGNRARMRDHLAPVYHQYIELLVEMGRPVEAFELQERSRARMMIEMLAERDLATSGMPPELERQQYDWKQRYERVLHRLGGLSAAEDTDEIKTLRAELRSLRFEREEQIAEIRAVAPKVAGLRYPKPLTLEKLSRRLDPDTVLLTYSVGAEETLLFVIGRGVEFQPSSGAGLGIRVFRLPLGEARLESEVRRFTTLIREAAPLASSRARQRQSSLEAACHRLYTDLIAPAEKWIEGGHRLLILPHGPLHYLPFGALMRQGEFLVEWKPLHFAASATAYSELRRQRRTGRSTEPVSLVAFGAPDSESAFGEDVSPLDQDAVVRSIAESGFNMKPLPAAKREVEEISALFPGGRIFIGDQATEERVKALRGEVRYVHFATHAVIDERFPLESALVMTIPKTIKGERENGLLQAWEIFEQVRLEADLVVLSGCQTGRGSLLRGEGLVGLTRAFHHAGARAVIASLWPVADRATSELMVGLYQQLKNGQAYDEALRAAQIELIRSADTSSPYYWAAFQLHGAPASNDRDPDSKDRDPALAGRNRN